MFLKIDNFPPGKLEKEAEIWSETTESLNVGSPIEPFDSGVVEDEADVFGGKEPGIVGKIRPSLTPVVGLMDLEFDLLTSTVWSSLCRSQEAAIGYIGVEKEKLWHCLSMNVVYYHSTHGTGK